MNTSEAQARRLPVGVKIAAGYLILLGVTRLIGLAFTVSSAAANSGLTGALIVPRTLGFAIATMLVIAGLALFRRTRWSRKFALGALFVAGYFFLKKGFLLVSHNHGFTSAPVVLVTCFIICTIVACVTLLKRPAIEVLG